MISIESSALDQTMRPLLYARFILTFLPRLLHYKSACVGRVEVIVIAMRSLDVREYQLGFAWCKHALIELRIVCVDWMRIGAKLHVTR